MASKSKSKATEAPAETQAPAPAQPATEAPATEAPSGLDDFAAAMLTVIRYVIGEKAKRTPRPGAAHKFAAATWRTDILVTVASVLNKHGFDASEAALLDGLRRLRDAGAISITYQSKSGPPDFVQLGGSGGTRKAMEVPDDILGGRVGPNVAK